MVHQEQGIQIKKGICRWCKGECGVLVYVKDGHLVDVKEDPDFPRKVWPPIKGCVRRRAAKEYFYHPERVNFPVKRAGEKGEGKWQRISWDQALDEIAERLRNIKDKYGGEAIVLNRGTGRNDVPSFYRFATSIGTPNILSEAQICYSPRANMADAVAGWFPHYSVKPTTKCIICLGVEPLIVRPTTAKKIFDARKNGAKYIVIDPRRTRSAAEADIWLQLRPGTDCALLMSMIKVIIDEELYDRDFVANWCYGFEEVVERSREYSPEKVEKITNIPADKIRQTARMYAQNRPGVFLEGMGVEHLSNNAEILHARWILAGLTGNIDVEGGEEFCGHHPVILTIPQVTPAPPRLSPEQRNKLLGADRFKLFGLQSTQMIAEATKRRWHSAAPTDWMAQASIILRAMISGEPYPVRAMITNAANPMVTHANTKLVYRALKSLDLYVCMEMFMTPSAELADYVLPIATWLERPELRDFMGYEQNMAAGEVCLPPVIPGEYEHKGDYEVFRELAVRLGYGEHWPWKTLEEFYDARLKPTGYTLKEWVKKVRCENKPIGHKAYKEFGFGTPTNKIEFHSTILEKLGYDALPSFREPAETPVSDPELAKEYPLQLITGGRVREYYHSEWRQIDSVRKLRPDPIMQIHPDTAAKLDISNGDWVWIETVRGRVRQKATLSAKIDPRVLGAAYGWWFREKGSSELYGWAESNINVLTDNKSPFNREIGSSTLRGIMCRVYKAEV